MSARGVSQAIIVPWSITARRVARRSASSMKCVVSRIVLPCEQQLAQPVPDEMARLRIEAGRRLVEDQELGIVDERPREREAPLHPARQHADSHLLLAAQPGEFEQLRNARGERRAIDVEIAAVDAKVLGDGEIRIEVVDLRHDAHADAGDPGGLGHALADHLDRAAIGIDEPEAAAKRRGLARAVGAEQREAFAAPDLEGEPAHDLVRAVELAEPRDPQHDVAHAGRTCRCAGGCRAGPSVRQRSVHAPGIRCAGPCHIPPITDCSCGRRPWKKWPQPGNTVTGSACGRAHASTSASGTTSSSSP